MSRDLQSNRFATLTFERKVAAPLATLYAAWTAPAARAVWAPPAPGVVVEFLEADSRVGGREVSLCKVAGQPDIRVEAGWLDLVSDARSVGYEVVSSGGERKSAALVTAEFSGNAEASRIAVTVQLASLAEDMADGYRQGFTAGVANLAGVAERTMLLQRVIKAPVATVWGAWMNAESLPKWWGPEGYSCRTSRIDLRAGGEWVFDMIGPDGTVYPNHHRYGSVIPETRLDYTLHWGENGPKHADAWAMFEDEGGATKVTLGMVMATAKEYNDAKGFGAVELGLQTLGKLARSIGAE
ncbi:SRPBCC domain-containing protein [Rhodobacter sp. SY28-1]|uniref:SRPBCC domain-containing protein n=1 Tax=Rhodobacter sp. SY28-1 TaxID=2562317 RepID=UPI0010C0955C|nr:SRPBCC domain-containing protein [Rhodobacter sp. SY28-1]